MTRIVVIDAAEGNVGFSAYSIEGIAPIELDELVSPFSEHIVELIAR